VDGLKNEELLYSHLSPIQVTFVPVLPGSLRVQRPQQTHQSEPFSCTKMDLQERSELLGRMRPSLYQIFNRTGRDWLGDH
jgi:hypothetical protein